MRCRQATSPFSRGGKGDGAKQGKGVGGFRGIVRFWKGWWSGNGWCDNPSGSRPNFFGRQHLTFDKGGKGVGGFRGIVRFWEGWVRNERLLTEVSEKRKGYGKCGNPSGSRPNFFGDSTSPLTREASVMVWGKGWCGDLSVVYILHCNRKNRVLCRTRLILTVDILFWRYPLSVLLYCKVKMRCQLRLAFDSPCNAYLLT